MAYYVVTNTYLDSPRLGEVRVVHREYLQTLVGGRGLRAAGPLPQASPPGGVLIFEAASADEVAALLADDPLEHAGLVASQRIDEWNPVIGNAF